MTEEQLTDSTDALEEVLETTENSNVPAQLQAHAYQPGQSGNPSGRPSKLKTLTGMLESKVNREEMATKLIQIATNNETPALQLEAIKYIYARIEGNPIQAMRHQIEGAVGPLIFLHPGKDVIEAQSNQELDSEANTVEGEVLDATADEPTQTDMSNTRPDPAGPPSV